MKKINYFLLVLLGITFFSCINEDLNNHSQIREKLNLQKMKY